jgi:hypothetical protein
MAFRPNSAAQGQDIFLLVLSRKLINAPDSSKNSKHEAAEGPH